VAVTILVTLGSVRSGFVHDPAAGQWHTFVRTQIVPVLASAPVGAGLWLWLAAVIGRGYHWARPVFAVFFGVLTSVLFVGLSEGGGEDALAYIWPDAVAAAVLWLTGLAAIVLVFSETASPYYQRRAATRAATPANGTGR